MVLSRRNLVAAGVGLASMDWARAAASQIKVPSASSSVDSSLPANGTPPPPPPPVVFSSPPEISLKMKISEDALPVLGVDSYTNEVFICRPGRGGKNEISQAFGSDQRTLPKMYSLKEAPDFHDIRSIFIDLGRQLWVLDAGLPAQQVGPRLIRAPHGDGRPAEIHDLSGLVSAGSILSDVVVDLWGTRQAYVADAGDPGALLILDLAEAKAWKLERGVSRTFGDPTPHGPSRLATYDKTLVWGFRSDVGLYRLTTAALATPEGALSADHWIDRGGYNLSATALCAYNGEAYIIDGNTGSFYRKDACADPVLLIQSANLVGAVGLGLGRGELYAMTVQPGSGQKAIWRIWAQ